jgi:hypothetical protein
MPISTLSDDDLLLIFSAVLNDGFAVRIVPLLRVSKRWKVSDTIRTRRANALSPSACLQQLATPLFFRHIRFKNDLKSLVAATTVIRDSDAHDDGVRVGCFIRTLHLESVYVVHHHFKTDPYPAIAVENSIAALNDSIMTIVRRASNLERLHLPHQITPLCVAVASERQSLRSLDLTLTKSNIESLRHLPAMQNLQQLFICCWDATEFPEDFTLQFPRLRALTWWLASPQSRAARFLAACRFPSLRRFTLTIHSLDQDLAAVLSFLRAHRHIQACALTPGACALLPHLTCYRLEFVDGTCPPHTIPDSVRELVLVVPWSMNKNNDAAIRRCLDALAEPTFTHRIRAVVVKFDPDCLHGNRFCWRDAARYRDYWPLAEDLPRYVPRLAARGITLLDEDGVSAPPPPLTPVTGICSLPHLEVAVS